MTDTDIVTVPESAPASGLATMGSEGVHEFIRYCVASMIALAVDMALLWLCTDVFGSGYLLSGAIAFSAGLIVVYLLSVHWVFSRRSVRSRATEFMIFALIGMIGLVLNEAILYIATSIFGIYYLISKSMSVFVIFVWNFAARKWILFRTEMS